MLPVLSRNLAARNLFYLAAAISIRAMSSAPVPSNPSGVAAPADVLDFWFAGDPTKYRMEWFKKDPAFDDEIRAKFLPTVKAAQRGELKTWEEAPKTALALLVTMDQFPRNLFRGSPEAFATDPEARRVCKDVLKKGWDNDFTPSEKMFVYLPLEHSEDLKDQELAVEMFSKMEQPEGQLTEYAKRHLVVIQRFGRFPHRNHVLGRVPTPEEEKYLAEGGESF